MKSKHGAGISNPLSRLSTGPKLFIAFGTAFASMALIGHLGTDGMNMEIKSMDIIFRNNLKPVHWINMVRIDLNANRTNLYHAIANKSNNAPGAEIYLKDIPVRAARIDANIRKARASMAELNDNLLMREIAGLEKNLATYRRGRDDALRLLRRGAVRQALFNAESHRQEAFLVFNNVARIAKRIETRADERRERGIKDAAGTRLRIWLASCAAAVVTGLIVLLIVFDLRNLINRLTKKIRAVSEGDFNTADFDEIRKNDIGTLYKCFNDLNGILKQLAFFIESASSATLEISSSAHELDKTADKSTHSAQQIASGLEELSAGTQEIATNLNVGFGEISKINSAIEKISRSCESSVRISEATKNSVLESRGQSNRAVEQVNSIREAATDVSNAISQLLDLSSEIESVIGLMSNIAEQTSLLSLNAAIEAARAGEHGRGFAVVAEEVGKLAGNSAQAAASVSNLIRETQTRINEAGTVMRRGIAEVEQGVQTIREVGDTMKEVTGEAEATSREASVVAEEVSEVSKGVRSLATLIENLAAIADESATNIEGITHLSLEQSAGTEQTFASAKSLTQIVEELNRQLGGFRHKLKTDDFPVPSRIADPDQ